jgi:hypothetical protein
MIQKIEQGCLARVAVSEALGKYLSIAIAEEKGTHVLY